MPTNVHMSTPLRKCNHTPYSRVLFLVANTQIIFNPLYTIVADDEAALGLGLKDTLLRRRREREEREKKLNEAALLKQLRAASRRVRNRHTRLQAWGIMDKVTEYVKAKAASAVLKSEQVQDLVVMLQDKLINLLEATSLFTIQFVNAFYFNDILTAICVAYKMITHKNLVSVLDDAGSFFTSKLLQIFPQLGKYGLQAGVGETIEQICKTLRKCLTNYKDMWDSPLVKKIQELFRFVLSFGLLESLGIDFKKCRYTEVEAAYVQQKHTSIHDFILTALDAVTFIVQRCVQACKIGSFIPFYHSKSTYAEWADQAQRLEEDSHKLVGPPETVVNEFKFTQDLNDCIERGEGIVKFAAEGKEKLLMKSMLRTLRLIKNTILTRRASKKERQPPFAVLLSGDSSVGKSKFKQLLFQQFGKNFDLPITEEYIYTRNPNEAHWNGFSSGCWCVVLDDIAMLNPNKAVSDPSITEGIPIVNPTPMSPPMADLEDKGRCPMRCALCIATTNQEDLNAKAYFSCPLAIRRRFKYIIDLKVKKKYAQDASPTMLDPAKCGDCDDEWANYWNIYVKQVVAVPNAADKTRCDASTAPLADFTGKDAIFDFMSFIMELASNHRLYAQSSAEQDRAMAEIEICKRCHRPVARCKCEKETDIDEIQSEVEEGLQGRCSSTASTQYEDSYDSAAMMEVMRQIATMRENAAHADSHSEYESDLIPEEAFPDSDDEDIDWFDFGRNRECLARIYMKEKLSKFDEHLLEQYAINRVQLSDLQPEPFHYGDILTFAKAHTAAARFYLENFTQTIQERITTNHFYIRGKQFIKTLAEMGKRVCTAIGGSLAVGFAACLAGVAAIYKIVRFFKGGIFEVQGSNESVAVDTITPLEGNHPSRVVGKAPVSTRDEGTNVWFTEDMLLQKFDLGDRTSSWKGMDWNTIQNFVSNNMVHFIARYDHNDDRMRCDSGAFCVAGHIYVTNNHCFPSCQKGEYEVNVIEDVVSQGVSTNYKVLLREKDIYRMPEKDLCFVRFCASVKKDLRDLIPKRTMVGLVTGGTIVGRRDNGLVWTNPLKNIHFDRYSPAGLQEMDAWSASPASPTVLGDCGSVYVANLPAGPVILGLHQSLESNTVHCTNLIREDVDKAIEHFKEIVVSRGKPQSAITKVTDLHRKSPIRYFEEGSAKVFGSVNAGFRMQPKSKVTKTLISEGAQELGYALKHGVPVMKGWEPKRKGLEHTLNISQKLSQSVLDHCVDSFADEVIAELDPKWKSEVHILDDVTTINGAPGVKFIDKMKRNTSMGYPWRKPKQYFMEYIGKLGDLTDAVDFTPEVYEEIDRIMDCYDRGERAHPVFTACLKDEPLPFKKIAEKKTRVFSISNAPFSFVMRKYLLTFVRLFQKNSFIFEGAPGINCGSDMWDKMYQYLTFFGTDVNIAGDYGKFDKHMEPMIIIAAFRFISRILRWCGWEEKDIRKVMCMAEDVAYALTEYFGDVIEFMGSNPSGQVLTVIINCIVNCLYMRYCMYFAAPSEPEEKVRHFKQFVKLMTYGDDNAMCVSKIAPWFNHTVIQDILASVGVEYTMADKEAESKPFIPITEVSFLKRTWRWEPALGKNGGWACPLDMSSMEKMLNITVRSDFLCPEQQAVASIRSAVQEFFYYGKDSFEFHCGNMRKLIDMYDLNEYIVPSVFPSWEDLVERWNAGTSDVALDIDVKVDEE